MTHPFGVDRFVAQNGAARGINFTEDIGCAGTPCDFGAALGSRIGPFLRWDPAVAPKAPKGYIGNPFLEHRVVGSPFGTNFFRIEGKNVGGPGVNVIKTSKFSLQGKIAGLAPAPAPAVSVTPASLDFGERTLLTPSENTVTVTNSGTADLRITGARIAGDDDPANFTVASDECTSAGAIPPGRNCRIEVRFQPLSLGAHGAQLLIESNAPGSPHSVSLSGTGTLP